MTGSRRSLTIASLASLLALAFAFSLFALAKDSSLSIGPDDGSASVVYTFDEYRCVPTQREDQRCGWLGTVTSDGVVEATNVEYRAAVVTEVSPGYQVPALWSYRDPLNAWSLEGSRAWLNNLANAAASLIFFGALAFAAVYWWRRFGRDKAAESEAAASQNGAKVPRDKQPAQS